MKIGFIGCGNMATAMLKGILKSGEVKNADMIASANQIKPVKRLRKNWAFRRQTQMHRLWILQTLFFWQ